VSSHINSESTSLTVRVGAHFVKLFGIATTLVFQNLQVNT